MLRLFQSNVMSSFLDPVRILSITGSLSVVLGLLYIPFFPWYILGNVKEEEIALWGIWSVVAGILTWGAAQSLRLVNQATGRSILLIAIPGLFLLLLAQVLPLLEWNRYGGSFLTHWVPWSYLRNWLGFSLHIVMTLFVLWSLTAVCYGLAAKQSPYRASSKQVTTFAVVMAGLALSFVLWDKAADGMWIQKRYPEKEAIGVPADAVIQVTWRGGRDNGGIRVRYADEPNTWIPGVSGMTAFGMFFDPEEPLLPGKKVVVTVDSGRRSDTFSFMVEEK
ncbi:hypothetical protein [Paenibacillus turpanensis]|uniref:hypothetical protein n=1 Tax=Paenibacillus turpanensis TaxID=2689078 RepID=UPI0014084E39|nr:hypothetical protein [Paenibacillus turpanensis]